MYSKSFLKKAMTAAMALAMVLIAVFASGQEQVYHPKGDPQKWNVELNPFLWLPAIGGEIESQRLSEEFGIPAINLLQNLKMAFMINAEVSKGKFFASTSYVYAKLGSEEVLWTSDNEEHALVSIPEIKLNIAELIAGMRFRVNNKFIIDPFAGFRYTSYNLNATVEKILDTVSFSEKVDYWDPLIGLQVHYFPHPRVPVILKTDIGGFGAGSEFSWSACLNSGYVISPLVDILAGFSAYGSRFEQETVQDNTAGLSLVMYGFDLGVRFHFPKRFKDKSVFKKSGKE